MQRFCMYSKAQHYRVDRHKIGYLKFILEAYEGLASMSTVDAGRGIVVLHIPPGCEKDVSELMQRLADEIFMEPYAEI